MAEDLSVSPPRLYKGDDIYPPTSLTLFCVLKDSMTSMFGVVTPLWIWRKFCAESVIVLFFTAQMRYKRKRVSKKLLQKLEIDFSDSDGEVKGAAAKLSSDKTAAQTGPYNSSGSVWCPNQI